MHILAVLAGLAVMPALALAQASPPPDSQSLAKPAPEDDTELLRKEPLTPKQQEVQREELLDTLLDQLAKVTDRQSASLIEKAVWKLWVQSPSPTAGLLMQQAVTLMNAGSLDDALKVLNVLIKIAPDFSEAWNKRATVYFLKQDFFHAQSDIAQTLALEPRHFGALSGLGVVLRETGQDKAALNAFRQALRIHPFLPAAKKAESELSKKVEGRGI